MYNIYATNENENGESENAMWATFTVTIIRVD